MEAWWYTGKIRIKTLRNIDRSPLRRDISKRADELPVTSVGGPTLSRRLVNRNGSHSVRRWEPFLKFRLRNRRLISHQSASAAWRWTSTRHQRYQVYRPRRRKKAVRSGNIKTGCDE